MLKMLFEISLPSTALATTYLTNDAFADKLDSAVTGQSEYVLVPRVPTERMLKEGWYEAHDENAAGVWEDMIKAWEAEKMDRERASGI